MRVDKFVVSECGNDAEDAWGRAQAIASLENQAEPQDNIGVLYKKGFKIVGKFNKNVKSLEAAKTARHVLECHMEISTHNDKALCLDAGNGEYYFIGKVELDK